MKRSVTLNPNRQFFYNFHHFLYSNPRDHSQNFIGIVDGKFWENTIEFMAMWYPSLGNEKDCNSKSKPPIILQFSPLRILHPKRSLPESHWNCRWQVLGNTIEVMAMWYPCVGNEKDCNSKSKPPIFLQFSPLPILDPKRSLPESHWNCRWQVLGINN